MSLFNLGHDLMIPLRNTLIYLKGKIKIVDNVEEPHHTYSLKYIPNEKV